MTFIFAAGDSDHIENAFVEIDKTAISRPINVN
jgi:hypothetical protein